MRGEVECTDEDDDDGDDADEEEDGEEDEGEDLDDFDRRGSVIFLYLTSKNKVPRTMATPPASPRARPMALAGLSTVSDR